LVAPEQPLPASRLEVGAAYDEHRRLLIGTAITRYGIAEADAEALVHDVFLSYLGSVDDVRDARAWLLSAICNASKHFLRTRNRVVRFPDGGREPEIAAGAPFDELPGDLAVRDCFNCITPRCQLALRLRYLEGYSVPEIATELNTTAKYAQKLVSRCVQQAHDRYAKGAV